MAPLAIRPSLCCLCSFTLTRNLWSLSLARLAKGDDSRVLAAVTVSTWNIRCNCVRELLECASLCQSRQRFPQSQLRWLMRRPVSKSHQLQCREWLGRWFEEDMCSGVVFYFDVAHVHECASLRLLVHLPNLLWERGRGRQSGLWTRCVRLPRVSCFGDNFASMLSVFNMWFFSEVLNSRSCDEFSERLHIVLFTS